MVSFDDGQQVPVCAGQRFATPAGRGSPSAGLVVRLGAPPGLPGIDLPVHPYLFGTILAAWGRIDGAAAGTAGEYGLQLNRAVCCRTRLMIA